MSSRTPARTHASFTAEGRSNRRLTICRPDEQQDNLVLSRTAVAPEFPATLAASQSPWRWRRRGDKRILLQNPQTVRRHWRVSGSCCFYARDEASAGRQSTGKARWYRRARSLALGCSRLRQSDDWGSQCLLLSSGAGNTPQAPP